MAYIGAPDNCPEIIDRGQGKRQEVAFTFDDGPSRWTVDIAATFENFGCRATFFMLGPFVEERPKDVAALAAAGHELGNHLWSHHNSGTLSQSELRDEVVRTSDLIQKVAGRRPELVRPPYLKGADKLARAVAACGITHVVLRSIGTSDWLANTPEEISEPILSAVRPGDIICLHDGISPDRPDGDSRKPTAMAVRQLVPALIDRGLHPVTVSQLLR